MGNGRHASCLRCDRHGRVSRQSEEECSLKVDDPFFSDTLSKLHWNRVKKTRNLGYTVNVPFFKDDAFKVSNTCFVSSSINKLLRKLASPARLDLSRGIFVLETSERSAHYLAFYRKRSPGDGRKGPARSGEPLPEIASRVGNGSHDLKTWWSIVFQPVYYAQL